MDVNIRRLRMKVEDEPSNPGISSRSGGSATAGKSRQPLSKSWAGVCPVFCTVPFSSSCMQAGTIRRKGGLSVIRKGISRRWFINTIGIVFVILTVSIVTLSLMVQSSAYNGIELVLTGRVDELLNMLSGSSGGHNASEFTAITRDYIENFRIRTR